MKIEKNKVVTLTYELRVQNENGEQSVIEIANEEQPMAFIYGMSGLPDQFEENLSNLSEGDDFDHLRDGQVVEFDEEPDRANGTHAYNVIPVELPANAKA